MNDPRNELHALYTLLRQRELNSDIAPRKWLVRENRLGFSGSRMYPSHTVHAVYSKVDAAKEFSHRDESGAAETVLSDFYRSVAISRYFSNFFRNISISLPHTTQEHCDTYSRRTQVKWEIDVFNSRVLHILSLLQPHRCTKSAN